MKILSFYEKASHDDMSLLLAKFTCTLFENSEVHYINPEFVNNIDSKFLKKTDLIVLSINQTSNDFLSNLENLSKNTESILFNKKPIFILYAAASETSFEQVKELIHNKLKNSGSPIIGEYTLENFDSNFSNHEIIKTIKLGELHRIVNGLKKSHFSSEYKFQGFTCGIDPNRDYCGDAIEY